MHGATKIEVHPSVLLCVDVFVRNRRECQETLDWVLGLSCQIGFGCESSGLSFILAYGKCDAAVTSSRLEKSVAAAPKVTCPNDLKINTLRKTLSSLSVNTCLQTFRYCTSVPQTMVPLNEDQDQDFSVSLLLIQIQRKGF